MDIKHIFKKMKSYVFCPISEKKLNENFVRFNALLAVIVILFYLFFNNPLIILVLFIDYLIRVSPFSGYSPFNLISKVFFGNKQKKAKMINAGPKIFASFIGLIFSGLIIVFYLISWNNVSQIVALLLLIFSFLEGAFRICLACIIYPYIYLLLYKTPFNNN